MDKPDHMTPAEFRSWRRIFDMRVNEGCEVGPSAHYATQYVSALREAEALRAPDDDKPKVEDPNAVCYRAIIEGLLRYGKHISEIGLHHLDLLKRAYDACGIETVEVTRYFKGKIPFTTVVPASEHRETTIAPPDDKS